jgi:Arc/MetJ-type ribon-helix-helix transcriptional regulator
MRQSKDAASNSEPPRHRGRRSSYSEQTDEALKLLEDEPVEVERELPAEDNSPIERTESHGRPPSPLFEY